LGRGLFVLKPVDVDHGVISLVWGLYRGRMLKGADTVTILDALRDLTGCEPIAKLSIICF